MEFRLDEAQVELQQTVARFCSSRFPLDAVGAREGLDVDRAAWAEMAGLGIHGLLLPEAAGGSGLGPIEAAIVFEQLGSHLVPGPVLWSVLAAGLVDGAAAGEVVVGGIEAGEEPIVEHAGSLDVLLVLDVDEVRAHRTDRMAPAVALDPLDPLTPVGRFDDLGAGEVVGGPGEAAAARTLGTVLSAATLAGIAQRSLDVAGAYALERHQFGVPIGSFQAVKHLLADMYLRATMAQSAVYAAAADLDDPARAAGIAKLLAGEAAVDNASTAIQVLGGMGFTWEMLPNHLLKRAWVVDRSFGVADHHAGVLGSAL